MFVFFTILLSTSSPSEPKKLCDFRPIEGKILKTVDFVYQNVKSTEECREKCLSSPYRCHSFDLGGDPSSPNRVCRTSHLDKYSLAHIEEAYLQVPGAITYELHSCYNGKFSVHVLFLRLYLLFVFYYLSALSAYNWPPSASKKKQSIEQLLLLPIRRR